MRRIVPLSLLGCFAMMSVSVGAGPNLIVNGDFEAGNTGFITDYEYNGYHSTSTNPDRRVAGGQYTVYTNPAAVHNRWASYGDHTTGAGNMLIVNAAYNPSLVVWKQEVTVVSGATYTFSYWLNNCYYLNPGQIECKINGILLVLHYSSIEG